MYDDVGAGQGRWLDRSKLLARGSAARLRPDGVSAAGVSTFRAADNEHDFRSSRSEDASDDATLAGRAPKAEIILERRMRSAYAPLPVADQDHGSSEQKSDVELREYRITDQLLEAIATGRPMQGLHGAALG